MARIRTIKPEFWESEKAGKMSPLARLTFLGLISLADDEGRGRAGVAFLLGRLHPYGNGVDAQLVAEALQEIENTGLVRLYDGPDGCSYYHIPGWTSNQKIDRPSKSKLPKPPTLKNSTKDREVSRGLDVGSGIKEGKGKDQGEEGKVSIPAPSGAVEVLSSPKPMTPLQIVMRAYKVGKGIPANDADWDKANFAVHARAAKKLLAAFNDDDKAAVAFLLGTAHEWDEKGLSGWSLAGVAKKAWDDRGRNGITPRDDRGDSGVLDGEAGQVGSNRLLDARRHSGITPAGELAQQALRAIPNAHSGLRLHGRDEHEERHPPFLDE